MRVRAIRTGSVEVHRRQVEGKGSGIRRRAATLLDRSWSGRLPILAWAIEHPDGVVVVDTGESARVREPGYLPRWHPYYRTAVRFDVRPEDEIGPQLQLLDIDPGDVRTVILTHLHTDHAGGLSHFPRARFLVAAEELAAASGLRGRLDGYLAYNWPGWFAPTALDLSPAATVGAFVAGAVVADGIRVVATPGHTPGHVSVLVEDDPPLILAGDATYRLDSLMDQRVDGLAPDDAVALQTLGRLREYVQSTGAVYLPTHDPESVTRLAGRAQASA